ncbi:MAG TPA: hypothetical protein VG711_12710 [Phycisphaerales bacterium]|nr:hypothetical protein [Phycisphaerales bacterium]
MNLIPAIVQAVFAIVGLDILRRRVLPRLNTLPHAGLFINVWGPIALVLPMLAAVRRVDADAGVTAWPALGQIFLLMPIGVACAMLVGRMRSSHEGQVNAAHERQQWADWACWVGAAMVFVLMTALGQLSMPVGQCAFALGAVLMWWRTPDSGADSESMGGDAARTWNAISIVLMCAIAQSAAVYFCTNHEAERASVLVTSLYVLLFFLLSARVSSAETATRLGGWSMAMGGLMCLGVIAMARFFPTAIASFQDRGTPAQMQVAYGLGRFTLEASTALVCASAGPLLLRWPGALQRMIGAIVLAMCLALEAWRIAGFSFSASGH